MAKVKKQLVVHTFKGGRFDDHGVDLDVLPDLLAYKTLLVETAKELWRRKNPERERLPKNFEDSLSLKFYEVRAGSAAIPLIREIETENHVEGRAQFLSGGQIQRIIQVDRVTLLPTGAVPFDSAAKPIWDVFAEIVKELPAKVLNALPTDTAENHDHYIYGAPKRKS